MPRKRGFESIKKSTRYINVANAQRKRWSSAKDDFIACIGQTDHSYADLQLDHDTTPAKAICPGMSYISWYLYIEKKKVILE